MAITIDWGTQVINVPRADMVLVQTVPTEIRSLNLNSFRQTLNDLQDDAEGISFPTTHRHVAPITVGGVTLERVVEIINGYTITFEDGQYAVNLVGANSNVADVANVNQVSIRASNSAGLVNLDLLLVAAYNGKVVVDTANGQAGTDTPLGTEIAPVNNMQDAQTIADARGITAFEFLGTILIDEGDFSAGYTFFSRRAATSVIHVGSYANVFGCTFRDCTITGEVSATCIIRECLITNLTMESGVIYESLLDDVMYFRGSQSGEQVSIIQCYSNVAGGGPGQYPVLDFSDTESTVLVRDYHGGLGIRNHNGLADISIDMAGGRVVFESTVTAGNITVRGVADIDDQTTDSNVNINNQTVRGRGREDLAITERRIIEAEN